MPVVVLPLCVAAQPGRTTVKLLFNAVIGVMGAADPQGQTEREAGRERERARGRDGARSGRRTGAGTGTGTRTGVDTGTGMGRGGDGDAGAGTAGGDSETTGAGEEPETRGRLTRVPGTMFASAAALLLGGLAAGCVPALSTVLGRAMDAFTDHTGYATVVLHGASPARLASPPPHWTATGVLLGLLSSVLALTAAAAALRATPRAVRPHWSLPLRRLHSGHVGDYVACALLGITLLGALLW
ncbi:hypothetical protein [Streptomyces axinellae]|uniref:Uncharacterized protein n=1 Tax=Streptomyces axinellae TaxID=552788 RepID=A0ABP6CEH4_9ACTN